MKVKLGDYVNIKTGKLDANASDENGIYPFFTCSVEPLKINDYAYDCECVLVAGNGDLNVKYYNGKFNAYQRTYIIESRNKNVLTVPYLYCFLDKYVETLRVQAIGGVIKYIKLGNLTEAQILLPPENEQNRIVIKLHKVNELIEKRKQQLEKLDLLVKSQFIEMFGDVTRNCKYPTIELGKISEMVSGGTPSSKNPEYFGGNIPFVSTPCLGPNFIDSSAAQNWLTEAGVANSSTHIVPAYSFLIGNRVGVGKSSINTCEMCTNQDILSFVGIDTEAYDLLFIKKVLEQYEPIFESQKRGATIKGIPSDLVKASKIPQAPIEVQRQFAEFVKQSDKSKLKIKQSLEKLETLKKALMQKYFG